MFVAGFSSILTGFNFIVTVHRMRAPGLTWFRLPLFVWANYATSLVMILGTPVVAITLTLVAAERALHLGIFDPRTGGDPVLMQHLFWFYSHPAVYIMILPGMGVISELVAAMSRKQIFGYGFVAFSSLAIAVIGFLVWGHHLFVSSQSIYAGLVFSFISMLVAVPSAVKTFNWTATMYKGSVSWESPTFFVVGFMGLFTIGGLTGLYPGDDGDGHRAARHLFRRRALPLHHGRRRRHGLHGRPALLVAEDIREDVFRSVGQDLRDPDLRRLQPDVLPAVRARATWACRAATTAIRTSCRCGTSLSTAGASILGLGYLLPMIYLTYSVFKGATAPANPWGAKGLEWTTTSPPPTFNFDGTSRRRRARLQLPAARGGHRWLTATTLRSWGGT